MFVLACACGLLFVVRGGLGNRVGVRVFARPFACSRVGWLLSWLRVRFLVDVGLVGLMAPMVC